MHHKSQTLKADIRSRQEIITQQQKPREKLEIDEGREIFMGG
jgi:hypothetical protein